MKNLFKNRSLFSTLLKNYILFSVSTIIICVIALAIGAVGIFHTMENIEDNPVYHENRDFMDGNDPPDGESYGDINLIPQLLGPPLKVALRMFVAMYFLSIVMFAYFLNKKIKIPLEHVKSKMDSAGSKYGKIEVDGRWNGEIIEIAQSFNSMSESLRKSVEEKERLEQSKRKILADISHDIRTPITTINGYASALSQGYVKDGEHVQKYLQIISKKSIAVTNLIDILFEYVSVEHPNFMLELEEGDICEFVREIVAENYEYATDKNFEVAFDIPDEEVICSFDRKHLKRAVSNLIANALKYNPQRTQIYIGLEAGKTDLVISVCDTGVGIPDHIRKNIFEPFVTGNESRTSSTGTGLGLSISREIIEKHGGTIKLLEAEDRYSTRFEIVLPIGS